MRYLTIALLTLGCSVFTAPEAGPTIPPPVSAVGRALDATVALMADEGDHSYCTGVWVKGLILTAYHCVDDKEAPTPIHIRTRDQHRLDALRVYGDEGSDFAILTPTSLVPHLDAPLAPEDCRLGDPVVVVGHPRNFRWFITTGVCNGIHKNWGEDWLMHSADVFFGNSGGPVFNQYAEVIGITSWMGGAEHLAAAVPLHTILEATQKRTALIR